MKSLDDNSLALITGSGFEWNATCNQPPGGAVAGSAFGGYSAGGWKSGVTIGSDGHEWSTKVSTEKNSGPVTVGGWFERSNTGQTGGGISVSGKF